jgi:hypothetical protein
MDEAPKSYRERQKEARAAASAKRKAEKAAWKRMIALDLECRRMALQIVKDQVRASGRKVTDYSVQPVYSRRRSVEQRLIELHWRGVWPRYRLETPFW